MEEREKIIKFFYEQLEKLKAEHVEDLMKAYRSNELERIVKEEIDFSPVKKFIKKNESLCLSGDEIKEEFCYEIALYVCESGNEDAEFFEDYEEFQKVLRAKNEELAILIAENMDYCDLREYSIKDLIDVAK